MISLEELLSIEYPIIQGGMARVAKAPLVAAVSEAGGLGVLGGAAMTPEELRDQIREVLARPNKGRAGRKASSDYYGSRKKASKYCLWLVLQTKHFCWRKLVLTE